MDILRFIMGLRSINRYTNHLSANAPNTLISTSCPIVPTLIATAPLILLFGDRKNTLPPYSPIRFGVKIAQVNPQKTDSTAFQVLIISIFFTRYFHLRASRKQFSNINKNRLDITIHTLPGSSVPSSILKSLIPRLSLSLLYMYQEARPKMVTLILILRIFLVGLFKIFYLCNVKKKLL